MSQSNIYVKFNPTGLGAFIFINPPEPIQGALFNPNMDKVRKLPPEFWKLEDNKIVPMNLLERTALTAEQLAKPNNLLRKIKHIVVDREVIKEVPVEVIREVTKEVIKEVPVIQYVPQVRVQEVVKRVIVNVPVEVIKTVEVQGPTVEVIKEVIVDRVVYKQKKLHLILAAIAVAIQLAILLRGSNG